MARFRRRRRGRRSRRARRRYRIPRGGIMFQTADKTKFFSYVCQPFCITDKYGRRQSVPCGKCLECLQEKKQEWCFRLDIEKRYSDASFFVTLTYED